MFKNRFLLVLSLFSLLLITMAVSRPLSNISVSNLGGSDYYERHPELRESAASIDDRTGDFALRHPEWTVGAQNAVVPMTDSREASDYFQRHPGLRVPASSIDLSDYFQRHRGSETSCAPGRACSPTLPPP